MSPVTWTQGEDQAIACLLGHELRDELTDLLAIQWPSDVSREPTMTVGTIPSEPPMPARLAVSALAAEARQATRRALEEGSLDSGRLCESRDFGTALEGALQKLRDAARRPAGKRSVAKTALLGDVAVALATELAVSRIRAQVLAAMASGINELAGELAAARNRTGDDWVLDIDGAPIVYRTFAPPFWDSYRAAWQDWARRVDRLQHLVATIVEAELAAEGKEPQ